ncbi:glycosyl hydrolase family 28-related protein [Peribacillus butanolivorans]|uniref:glycosyl hydrolase family 28-related protein n=1 Tax=Peribacillus butanolivorans TaxID=421767 RepID=UPI00365936FD
MINVKTYGAIGDGISDDSFALIQANAQNNILYFPKGHYKINTIPQNTKIKGIIGESIEDTTIEFAKDISIIMDEGFILSKVTIKSNSSVSNAINTKVLFRSDVFISNCLFENIKYLTDASPTGDTRGSTLIYGYIRDSYFNNISISGARTSITMRGSGFVNNIFNSIRFINVQTGFYITSTGNMLEQIASANSHSNLTFNNISLINTPEQKEQYSQSNGSSLFMFEQVKDVFISNVYSERACERTAYFNCCENIAVSNFTNKDCEGYHFVGYINLANNVQNIGKGFKLSNGNMFRGVNKERDHCVMLYDCENVVIENIIAKGSDLPSVISSNCFLTAHSYLKNITVKNILASNYNRNFMQFVNETIVASTESVATWIVKPVMYDILIENCKTNNTNLGQYQYPAIRFATNQTVMDSLGVGNYVFNNVTIINNSFKQAIANPLGFGHQSSEKLRAIVTIDSINGMYLSNNVISGHSSKDAIEIGVTSKNVVVDVKTIQQNENIAPPSSVYVSQNSRVTRVYTTNKINFIFEAVPLRKVSINKDTTKLIHQQCSIKVNGDILLNPAESFQLFDIDSYYKHSELTVIKHSHSDRCNFIHKHVLGDIVMNGDNIFSKTDAVDKICFYRDSTGLALKNNTINPVSLVISGLVIYDNTPRYY